MGVANFQGVDQTTPLDLAAKKKAATNNTVSSVSVDVTTAGGNELVFDTVFGGGTTAPTLTPGTGQIPALWNLGSANASSGAAAGGGSTESAAAPGGTVTMSWTRGNTGYMAIIAVPINPAPAEVAAPTVTINQAAGQADPTNASPINFTVMFSETVTGFATGDVTLSGTAGATTGHRHRLGHHL